MKRILLISALFVSLLNSTYSQTWIGISHTVGLKSVQLDYYEPDATIEVIGLSLEKKYSKHLGFSFGITRLRYNCDFSNINYSFTRYPFTLKYYGRFLNIKPTVYFNLFHDTNNPEYEFDYYSDLAILSVGYGVSFSKDITLSKRFLLEPEVTYLSSRLMEFHPELTFGIHLKYQLK